MGEKPILFNTQMVRAILNGSKTQTRRLIKRRYDNTVLEMKTDKYGTRLIEIQKDEEGVTFGKHEDGSTWRKLRAYVEPKPAYKHGDILYVRETWRPVKYKKPSCAVPIDFKEDDYAYFADGIVRADGKKDKWRPSIHMPKEAARIFLRVTNVRLERLKDISERDAISEGFDEEPIKDRNTNINFMCSVDCLQGSARGKFALLWNTTVKPDTKDIYGWDANPWVWVYTFERIDNPREANA